MFESLKKKFSRTSEKLEEELIEEAEKEDNLQEESGKRFSLNPEEVPNITLEKENYDIKVENARLREENEILKQKMDAILKFIKEHKG